MVRNLTILDMGKKLDKPRIDGKERGGGSKVVSNNDKSWLWLTNSNFCSCLICQLTLKCIRLQLPKNPTATWECS